MTAPITIIGSGFAAYQLVKAIRRLELQTGEPPVAISLFTANNGAEYNKPDLSHVFSKQQTASDLVIKSGEQFAQEHNVVLHANSAIERIDSQTQQLFVDGIGYSYSKLVFATGASAFIPPMQGDALDQLITLNSLQEYQAAETRLRLAERLLVIGGGLIGVEIAMDLASSGKAVNVVEPNNRLLASLVPEFVALPLEQQLRKQGIELTLGTAVEAIHSNINGDDGLYVTLGNRQQLNVDAVICAAGLRANTQLAKEAGIEVNKGICVDAQLQSSQQGVYALGDCAEIQGRMMPYLQPIVLSANVLAKHLLGQEAQLTLPAMMVKVKTPSYPIQLAGNFEQVASWDVQFTSSGITARAKDENANLVGFVVTSEQVSQAFPLLRELSIAPRSQG